MLSRLNSSSSWMDDSNAVGDDGSAAWYAAHYPCSSAAPLDDVSWFSSSSSAAAAGVDPTFASSGAAHHHLLTSASSSDPFHLLTSSMLGPTPSSSPFITPASQHPLFVGPTNSFADFSGFGSAPASLAGLSSFSPLAFDAFETRSRILHQLDLSGPVGAQPTLFQKRAARQNPNHNPALFGFEEKRRRLLGSEDDEFDDGSVDGSGINYDSDEPLLPDSGKGGEQEGGKNASAGGEGKLTAGAGGENKGKKKGFPAKNLMAERRRRKKLNDRLYMLRSVVPKISKMDRASILGDAIDYLKELLQKINDLHNELESTPSSSSQPTPISTSFHPPTPTIHTLPSRVKEELYPSSLSSPTDRQTKVEVRVREGKAVNIHMFCARRPGLLLSTMRALDGLGIDIQQAVISCFNGFALDVFQAEQLNEGLQAQPEEIKAVLLHSAGLQNAL